MKLTPTMLRTLTVLGYQVNPIEAFVCRLRIPTLEALEARGLVKSRKRNVVPFDPHYHISWSITPAGRQALKGGDA